MTKSLYPSLPFLPRLQTKSPITMGLPPLPYSPRKIVSKIIIFPPQSASRVSRHLYAFGTKNSVLCTACSPCPNRVSSPRTLYIVPSKDLVKDFILSKHSRRMNGTHLTSFNVGAISLSLGTLPDCCISLHKNTANYHHSNVTTVWHLTMIKSSLNIPSGEEVGSTLYESWELYWNKSCCHKISERIILFIKLKVGRGNRNRIGYIF